MHRYLLSCEVIYIKYWTLSFLKITYVQKALCFCALTLEGSTFYCHIASLKLYTLVLICSRRIKYTWGEELQLKALWAIAEYLGVWLRMISKKTMTIFALKINFFFPRVIRILLCSCISALAILRIVTWLFILLLSYTNG